MSPREVLKRALPPPFTKFDLNQMKEEIEQSFRIFFPDAYYDDLDTQYSEMIKHISGRIRVAEPLVEFYPQHAKELQQWENLKSVMESYNQLKQSVK